MRRFALPALLSVFTLFLAVGDLPADTIMVEMLGDHVQGDFRFSPADVTVRLDDTVIWINNSPPGVMHTVTYGMGSDDPMAGFYFDSGLMGGRETFSYTFSEPGTFPYFCIPHEFFDMTGVVRVRGTIKKGPHGTY